MAATSASNNSFGEFKTSLENQLTSATCKRLCVLFECSPAKTDKILNSESPGLEILQVLTENNTIEEHDVTKLEVALRKLDLTKAADIAKAYQQHINEDDDIFPVDMHTDDESDEEDSGNEESHGQAVFSFDTFLDIIGLKDKFPGHLNLDKLCYVKDPDMQEREVSISELFWQQLSALDYRARSRDCLKSCMVESSHQISVRDFIFAFMHCSDSFLRQDVLEKMSACQLAVPIILQGVKGVKSIFLSWSLRRIVKEWKRVNFTVVEHHIVTVPTFSVSFLRIGDIKDFSKSIVLNHLLGVLQGHHKFSYFLSREDDSIYSKFANGCVECIWYLPTNSNVLEKFKWIISFFNLRGDATSFPTSVNFICKASNLTFAFIAKRNQEGLKSECKKFKAIANEVKFIVIDDEPQTLHRGTRPQKWIKDFLFVRCLEIDNLCAEICSTIVNCYKKCPGTQLRTLDSLREYCENIDVEDDTESLRKARSSVTELLEAEDTSNLAKFKIKAFPLQYMWCDWVKIDKEPIKPDGKSEKSVDLLLEEIQNKKDEKRKQQLDCGLSQAMKYFEKAISNTENDIERLGYFVSYLQEKLRQMEDENIRENLDNIVKLEKRIENIDKRIKNRINAAHQAFAHNSTCDLLDENELRKERQECEAHRQNEAHHVREKNLGWEHFIRELGQWYEAHKEFGNTLTSVPTKVFLLPSIATRLLMNGHAVEIMDGDTGRVPLSWISSVLNELVSQLDDSPILVVCVVGVQSSGKSTLLNTMFGVQFPVRSGQCTKGLFLRVLRVDENYAEKLGVKYIFLIDSEGIRSQERISNEDYLFDNELVTLVLCISDVTLLNIAGENVGPEMTGLLQIAAHALIRMKKVDLHSQCRIVQQRVSKVSAEKRNKVVMTQIESTLNKAIQEVSNKEGFGNRYEQFSDVFDIRRGIDGENLQYFPSLWTGSMSPPQEMYGHIVRSVKNSILKDVVLKEVNPQFTISTFRQRIRDVWTAVKDEQFLFNFQDSIKAMDFDNLCMEVNMWIKQLKLDFMHTLSIWQRNIQGCSENPKELLFHIINEMQKELESKKEQMFTLFSSYVSEHPRRDFISSYKKWIDQQIEVAITQEGCHVITVLNNDVTTKIVQNDIPKAVAKMRVKLREDAKVTAAMLRNSSHECDIEKEFSFNWDIWVTEREKEFLSSVISEETLAATCEDILVSLTTGMALSTGIEQLNKEGGIRKHSTDNNWVDYYPKKGYDDYVDQWFQDNIHTLETIIHESLVDMEERNSAKKFDANLLHYVLRDALQKLSLQRFTSEPHHLLKAKVMHYICGKLFEIVLQSQRSYEAENSFLALVENEKQSLREDFLAFYKCDNLIHRVLNVFQNVFTDKGVLYIYDKLGNNIQQDILKKYPHNRAIHMLSMFILIQRNNYLNYITYMQDNITFMSFALISEMLGSFGREKREICLVIQTQAQTAVDGLIKILLETIEHVNDCVKLNKQHNDDLSPFGVWIQYFMETLNSKGFIVDSQSLPELLSYEVQDLEYFIHEFTKFVNAELKNIVMQNLKIPDIPDTEEVHMFFLNSGIIDNNITFLLDSMCFEHCPLCGAPCENTLPSGPNHGDHFALTHLPRGISGKTYRDTTRLDTSDCETCVGSSVATYTLNGQKKFCKNYKQDFPLWLIQPKGELLPKHLDYWKWVMKTYNREFAKHYECQPAKLPPNWKRITKERALQCVDHLPYYSAPRK